MENEADMDITRFIFDCSADPGHCDAHRISTSAGYNKWVCQRLECPAKIKARLQKSLRGRAEEDN